MAFTIVSLPVHHCSPLPISFLLFSPHGIDSFIVNVGLRFLGREGAKMLRISRRCFRKVRRSRGLRPFEALVRLSRIMELFLNRLVAVTFLAVRKHERNAALSASLPNAGKLITQQLYSRIVYRRKQSRESQGYT
jgi:hypothetical protein